MTNFFLESIQDPIILTVLFLQLTWFLYAIVQLRKIKNDQDRIEINFYSFESIPSTFVTIGLFGTCLGIAIGLYHFDVNPSNIKNSVQVLLRGLKSAFFTTILGLLLSLISKQLINYYLNKYDDIQPPISPELKELRQMNESLKLLGENISESFRRKFDVFIDDMRESNGKLIENLNLFTSNLAEQNQQALVQGLEGLVNDLNEGFRDILGALVHQNFQSLVESVNNLNKWQLQHKEQVELLTSKYLEISTNTEKLNKSLSGIISKNDELIGQNSKLNEIIDALNEVMVNDDQFVEIIENLKRSTTNIDKAASAYDGNIKVLNELKKSVDKWFSGEHGLKESILLLNNQLDEIQKIKVDDIPIFNDRLGQTFATLDKILNEYHKGIPKIIEKELNKKVN